MTYAEFEPWFKELRWRNPEAYRKALAYSEGVTLKHDLAVSVEADIEQATVMLACELLEITPAQRRES